MANIYIHNRCHWKGFHFFSHPQFAAPKGKLVVLTIVDRRAAIFEGVDIPKVANAKSGSDSPPFVLVGDPNATELKSFW